MTLAMLVLCASPVMFVVFHGRLSRPEPLQQAYLFAQKLR